jgi:CRISPR system Cascade subunit CasA
MVLDEAADNAAVTLGVGGLLTDKAKLVLWRIDQVTAPIQVLESAQLQGALALALEAAEQAGRGLFGAMSDLARFLLRESGDADKADTRRVVDGLPGTRHYWHQLDLEFPHFLQRLNSPDSIADALAKWRHSLLTAVEIAWRESVRSAGQTRRALIAAAKAEAAYRRTKHAINEKLEVGSEGSITG